MSAENTVGKQRGRPFLKGRSGNPNGKPKGTRHRATQLAEELLRDDVGDVICAVLTAAKGGDMVAARLVLERIVPIRKGRPVIFDIPTIQMPSDVLAAVGSLVAAMAAGRLTPDEASAAAAVIEVHRKTVETVDLDTRLATLESKERS